jgi:hypothetical protein
VKGDEIPRTDHVALHCPPSRLDVGPDGQPNGLGVEAFRVDDSGISVNWVEYEPGPFEECFEKTCCLLAATRGIGPSHRCAIFKVDEIIQTAEASRRAVAAVHDPVDPPDPNPNPAHSLIKGCVPGDELLDQFRLLAEVREFTLTALEIAKKRGKKK